MGSNLFDQLFSLQGKTALVTGGASGIGRMIAEALHAAGATVFIASRKLKACEEAANDMSRVGGPGRVFALAGDVSTEAGISALIASLKLQTSTLDILVNNAGVTWGATLEEFPHHAWERVLSVNVTGVFALTQALLPMLRANAGPEQPARILNLGSILGTQPIGNNAYSYGVSKAAIHHLTRVLANELAAENITVNALAPGPFQSRMMDFAISDPARRERLVESVPLRRLGRKSDIAAAVLFLCGAGGSYVTGAVLPVDGGKHVAAPKARHSEPDGV